MKKENISTRNFCLLSGASGFIGVSMIVLSFIINAGPLPGASTAQLEAFGRENYHQILMGAWLQAVGPVFIVLFAFAVVKMAGATGKLAGWMTFFGASILMTVSLIEITFYIGVLFQQPGVNSPIIMNLINAVQHLYFIVAAPAFFVPLGIVMLSSSILPQIFGYFAIILGLVFATIGLATLFNLVLPPSILVLGSLQGVWWLSASVAFLLRANNFQSQLNQNIHSN